MVLDIYLIQEMKFHNYFVDDNIFKNGDEQITFL